METKVCKECGRELPVEQFSWKNKSKGLLKCRCKECDRLYQKKWYENKSGEYKK